MNAPYLKINMLSARPRRAFTLIELLVVMAIIGVLAGLLFPAVQAVRATARRTECLNNLRQISVAVQAYEAALRHYPVNLIGSGPDNGAGVYGTGNYSWLVPVLPHMEAVHLHRDFNLKINNGDADNFQISDSHPNALAVGSVVSTFLCPSDPGSEQNQSAFGSANPAPGSYAGNAGWPSHATGFTGERATPGRFNGVIALVHPSLDVSWHQKGPVKNKHIIDGLSHTALVTERLIQTGNSQSEIESGDPRLHSIHLEEQDETLEQITQQYAGADVHEFESIHIGRSWSSGSPVAGPTYMHVMPPNSPSGHYETLMDEGDHVVAAGSHHAGGVNLALCDGSLRFISDGIDNVTWWALGARDDRRSLSLD